jgi:dipeptidyl aminopeptidase/acylaminoacyl peptidase
MWLIITATVAVSAARGSSPANAIKNAVSPNGRWLVSIKENRTLQVTDLATRKPGPEWPTESLPSDVLFISDGRILFSTDSNEKNAEGLHLWELDGLGGIRERKVGQTWGVTALRLSPDGRQVAARAPLLGHVQLWSLPDLKHVGDVPLREISGQLREEQRGQEEITSYDYSTDGNNLLFAVSGQDPRVGVWSFAHERLVKEPILEFDPIARPRFEYTHGKFSTFYFSRTKTQNYLIGHLSPNWVSFYLLTDDLLGESYAIELKRRAAVAEHNEPPRYALTPDERFVAVAYQGGTLELFETISGELIGETKFERAPTPPGGARAKVGPLAFAPSKNLIVISGASEPIFVTAYDPLMAAESLSEEIDVLTLARLDDEMATSAEFAYPAMARLIAGRDDTVDYLASDFMRRVVGREKLTGLIDALDEDPLAASPDPQEALIRWAERSEAMLATLQEWPRETLSERQRAGIERVLKVADGRARFPFVRKSETRRDLRAIAVLEHIHTPAAMSLLKQLSTYRLASRRVRDAAIRTLSR